MSAVQEAVRTVGGLVAWPTAGVLRAVQSMATGSGVVVHIEVEHLEDARHRAAFLSRLSRAGADPNVAALMLTLTAPPGGWASCADLRTTIQRIRAAGRPVYAVVEAPGNALVWIASACDRVFMVPTGEVGLVGVGTELTFFGELFERLGVEPDFEAAGEYKSFGEPYTRKFASPANLEALGALIGDLQEQLVAGIAEGRKLEVERVRTLLAEAPLSAARALEVGLVDQLAYADEIEAFLKTTHGDKPPVEFPGWARRDRWIELADRLGAPGKVIAVLHLSGPIVTDDEGSSTRIRAKLVVPVLKKLREDDEVAAVVLNIDSPGGSALASDLIWREVDLLRQKKPVVACFEDVSASGGFYLSAPATEIMARPSTLTGSIGVFGGKLVLGEAMRKVGVHAQTVAASENATVFSPTRPFTDPQRERFRGSLQRFYDGFVKRVADGRGKPIEVIEPHCRGRVWTGKAALELGLIDRHGDLNDAVQRARELAKIEGSFRRRDVLAENNRSFVQKMLQQAVRRSIPMAESGVARLLFAWLGKVPETLQVVLEHPEQALAMLPFEIRVR